MKSNLKKASAIVASVFMGLSAVSVGLSTASAEDTPEAETPSLTENGGKQRIYNNHRR